MHINNCIFFILRRIMKPEEVNLQLATVFALLNSTNYPNERLGKQEELMIESILGHFGFDVQWYGYEAGNHVVPLKAMDPEYVCPFYERIFPTLDGLNQYNICKMVEMFHFKYEFYKTLEGVEAQYEILEVAIPAIYNTDPTLRLNADSFEVIGQYRKGGLSNALFIEENKKLFDGYQRKAKHDISKTIQDYKIHWSQVIDFIKGVNLQSKEHIIGMMWSKLDLEKQADFAENDEIRKLQETIAAGLREQERNFERKNNENTKAHT